MNSKEKGNLLEEIVEKLCSGLERASVNRNVKVVGKKTETLREIDVLIEGSYHLFQIKIAIEAKHYAAPVGVERVESFKAKLEDIGADLGVMVCPTGFTDPAKKRAAFDGIQLFEVFDHELGNSSLFVPLRYIIPEIQRFSFSVVHGSQGPFSIPSDMSRWNFQVDGKSLGHRDLVSHAWNKGMIPRMAGNHTADFGAIMLSDPLKPTQIQYCEVAINIEVVEKYFLKFVPASRLRNLSDGKENFGFRVDLYSKEEDMVKNGWKLFESLQEMNEAADIENQPESIRNFIVRPRYELSEG